MSRGWCLAGRWTPEAAVEHPEAILQLAREYSRCGADVTQTYTFMGSAVMAFQGSGLEAAGCGVTKEEVNKAACGIAARLREERGGLVAGGLSETGLYK